MVASGNVGEILQAAELRVLLYQFEPPSRSRNRHDANATLNLANDGYDRLRYSTWCECGNCEAMDKVEECNCCTESHEIMQKLISRRPQEKPDIRCITQLVGFQSVCLDPDVLQTAYHQYKEEHGAIQKTTEEKYRYIGYRQLVRWCYGVVGRKIRASLPSCAVKVIRATFPSDGSYKGFQWPVLD